MSYQYVEDNFVEASRSKRNTRVRLLCGTWTDAQTTVTVSNCGELAAWDASSGKRVRVAFLDDGDESERGREGAEGDGEDQGEAQDQEEEGRAKWDSASLQYSSATQMLLLHRSSSSITREANFNLGGCISETSLWDAKSFKRLAHHQGEYQDEESSSTHTHVAFHPSGKVYASGGASTRGVVFLCDASPDHSEGSSSSSSSSKVQFGSRLCEAPPSATTTATTTALAFSQSGRYLAVGTSMSTVELYHVVVGVQDDSPSSWTLRHLGTYTWTQRPHTPITALSFDRLPGVSVSASFSGSFSSPASQEDHLYVGQSDGQVILYDAKSLSDFLHKKSGDASGGTSGNGELPNALFQPILSWRPHATGPANATGTTTATDVLKPALLNASADGSIERVLLTASTCTSGDGKPTTTTTATTTAIQVWDFTARVGSKPVKLASVDVEGGRVVGVEWRPGPLKQDGQSTTTRSRGAFVVVTHAGLRWFRAAGEVGVEYEEQVVQDVVEKEAHNQAQAQAPVAGGQV